MIICNAEQSRRMRAIIITIITGRKPSARGPAKLFRLPGWDGSCIDRTGVKTQWHLPVPALKIERPECSSYYFAV